MEKTYVVLVTSRTLGDGAEELGKKLMSNYIIALSEGEVLPTHVLLMNTGVYLAKSGEKTVNALTNLVEKGVVILACGTCLDYYEMKDQLAVGQVTTIYSVRDIMADTNNVITLG